MESSHFADRLTDAIRARGNAVCVGLDPRWDLLPTEIRRRHPATDLRSVAAAFEEFSLRVLEVVAPLVPIVKPQSAFYEACGPEGLAALQIVLRQARQLGLVTILDSKRNDIASTAEAYADAAFGGVAFEGRSWPVWDADALTINPYLGRDAVEPFLKSARRSGRGAFVLVRTSNAGAGQFQDLVCDGEPLFQHVARAVRAWGLENTGRHGFGDVGAVAGATHPAELALLRSLLPECYLLVPGFGAQGATAADVASAFRADGLGAVVNSSRGIISCFDPSESEWKDAVAQSTRTTIESLRQATAMGNLASCQG